LSIYFLFTELLPLVLMLWAMKMQINAAKDKLNESFRSSATTEDEFSTFIGSQKEARDSLSFNAVPGRPLLIVKGKDTRSFAIPQRDSLMRINSPRA
jgi:hypothetical protein